jgi:membrane fusion protein, multidrug efflux system
MINYELRITNYKKFPLPFMVGRIARDAGGWLIMLAFLVSSCSKPAPPAAPPPTQLGPESYIVASVQSIESGPTISGTLVPRDEAVVKAQISGSVLRVMVNQGSPVRAGEVIATIDNSALTDAVSSAKNAVTNAQSALDVAKREQTRQESLLKAGAISQQSVDQAQRGTVSAEAGVAQAKAMLASAEKQLGYATVRAPFSGIVSEKSVSIGDVVQQGTALYTIVDPSTLELQGTIPADALSLVHVGLPVQFDVTGYPGRKFQGMVTRINPTADPMTRQVRIYADIPNKGQALVGGLFAQGRVASIRTTALALPVDAVDHRTITPAVILLHNGIVQRVPVTLGTLDEKNNLVEITSGINAGDTILRGAAMEIGLGSKVKAIASGPADTTKKL